MEFCFLLVQLQNCMHAYRMSNPIQSKSQPSNIQSNYIQSSQTYSGWYYQLFVLPPKLVYLYQGHANETLRGQ